MTSPKIQRRHELAKKARSHNLRPDQLDDLAKHRVPAVRAGVASNTKTPPETLARLAKDAQVRAHALANPSVPDDVLREAIPQHGKLVARNPRCDALMLREITERVEEDQAATLCVVAAHAECPDDLLEQLAQYDCPTVRKAVASNPRTPLRALGRLMLDADAGVRETAAKDMRVPCEILAEDTSAKVRRIAASRDDLTDDLVILLAQDKRVEVRAAVAGRTSLPEQAIASLVQRGGTAVWEVMAARQDVEEDIIVKAGTSGSALAGRRAAANPKCPPSLRVVLSMRFG